MFTAAERRRGYLDALARPASPRPALQRLGLVDSDAAERAPRELLSAADPPTALFAAQNLITIGAIRALRELGLQHEIALVGFDDVTLGDMVEPGSR